MSSGLAWWKRSVKAHTKKEGETVRLEPLVDEANLYLRGNDLQASAARSAMRTFARLIEHEMPETARMIVDRVHELDIEALKDV